MAKSHRRAAASHRGPHLDPNRGPRGSGAAPGASARALQPAALANRPLADACPPPPDRGPEHRTRLSSRPGTLLGGIHRRAKSQPGARSRSATSLCGHFLRPNTVHSSPIGPPCAPQVVEILPLGIEILVPSAPPGPHPVPQPGGGAHTFEWAGVGWRKQGLLMTLNQVRTWCERLRT